VEKFRFLGVVGTPLIFILRLIFPGLWGPVRSDISQGTRGLRAKGIGQCGVGNEMQALRLAALALICISAATAQTCSPVNLPAVIVQGQTFQPAIVNGVDDISYSTVRFQWTSDAAVNPVNLNRIVYATAAQWAANPGVYPYTSVQVPLYGLNNTTLQGNVVNNLAPGTIYHMAGQSSTNNGTTWCPASQTDTTFTTLAAPATIPKPTPPNTFSLTEPTITGTDYTVGVAPCTDFPTCVSIANPGDGIGIPPGSPVVLPGAGYGFSSFKIPAAAIAVTPNYSTSTFTAVAHGLTNGEFVHLGSTYYVPSPINPGVTYSIINATANTFQLSQDGSTALPMNDNGVGTIFVVAWPLTQPYIVIHSTANSANLPPAGVRLDPVAYGPYLGVIEMSSPGNDVLGFGFTGYLWFKDIEITIAPQAIAANETDPQPSGGLIQTGSLADHIVFDQCWFHAAPAPDRIEVAANWGGTNQAVMNSYIDNIDYWKATNQIPASTVGANSVTINPGSYYSVGANNTKTTCTINSPQSFMVGGAAGSLYVSMPPSTCALTVTASTGMTITGAGFTVNYSASPNYPVDASGNFTQLLLGSGSWNGTALGYGDIGGPAMLTRWGDTESATGWHLDDGPGPFMFLNNSFSGEGIIGIYRDEYTGAGCSGASTPCPYIYNTIDLTIQRSTIQWDPKYFNTAYPAVNPTPNWNGSWWFGRNAIEIKQGSRALIDGNLIGPVYGGLANGECLDLLTYYGSDNTSLRNTQSTSDIQFSNNTCANSGSTVTMEGWSLYQYGAGNPQERIWIYNNLFLNNNGWLATGSPFENFAQGRGIRIGGDESVTVNHNTFYEQAGSGSSSIELALILSGGLDIENNIFSYSMQGAVNGFGYDTQGGATSSPVPPNNTQGSALLPYLKAATLANNVFLGTWSTDTPTALVEMTPAQISAAAALYPASTYFPQGSTLANRISQTNWFSPAKQNFRLNSQSAYCSGCTHPASDGLDVGANVDALEAAQGKVSNVHVYGVSTNAATIGFLAPDSTGCSVDWGASNFLTGSGSWTRVANSGGTRVQSVALSGLPSATPIYYRVNCAVMQPSGEFSTP